MEYRFTIVSTKTKWAVMSSPYFVSVEKYVDYAYTTSGWEIADREIGFIRENDICVRFIFSRR